ncbi:TIGR03364 family FAD-dependent oxidoreductase [Saccharopolyspora griseoalba]|uniref:TIGR03364 family FAD-dependent oxidoreductase n=1 Tax=Saccharopolyspora griseoalba TaxID=1431848 RepID=A0ABW2LQK1_9PSEU
MSVSSEPTDLIVVGAGIVGLAHAVEAVERGLSVTVVERDERAVGASVRNFGHACITAQTGEALRLAERSRATWLRMGAKAGFDVAECGAVVVARSTEEAAALQELAESRGSEQVRLLTPAEAVALAPVADGELRGAALLTRDLRVDQRRAAASLAEWLAAQPGVRMLWSTPVLGVEDGLVRTGRGELRARQVVLCVGHDLDRILPETAEAAGMRRCALQMLQLRAPGLRLDPALLTGTSMLRYPALAGTEGAEALRARWREQRPELLDASVNHMLTQLPDGDLVVGDTHAYARTLDPWSSEELDRLLLAETGHLLGRDDLAVVRRWRGVYASTEGDFLRARVSPGVTAVSVTSGIGMTTAFGLAPTVLDSIA